MKKIGLLILYLLVSSLGLCDLVQKDTSDNRILENNKIYVYSDTVRAKSNNSMFHCLSFSPGLIPGFAYGWGEIKKSTYGVREKITKAHLNSSISVNTIGLGVEHNYFKNPERIGFFTSTYYGIDLLVGIIPDLPLDPGGWTGSGGGIRSMAFLPFPNLALGCGYSWKYEKKHSYFRISIDAGIKAVLLNLNLSWVF